MALRDQGQATPFPGHLHEASVDAWFEQRVRPLVSRAAAGDAAGVWSIPEERLTPTALTAFEQRMQCRGAPARAALTLFAGWTAGYVAATIAVGVLRDGVVIRTSSPGSLLVLPHADGWWSDTRVNGAQAAVAAGHCWSGRDDVMVVADPDALRSVALAEITRACTPIIEAIARRSRRGRAGLWAQVADAVADAASSLRDADAAIAATDAIAAIESLLLTSAAPWQHTPRLWLAQSDEGLVLVKHRRSCCLYYRFDPEASEAGTTEDEPDAWELAYRKRFGDETMRYCADCVFRAPHDVEAWALFNAEYARATSG